ncbi:THUMP-like domain-containing protein [Moheibacter sediminis]|uniref:Uncharacterized protein n=1 Tax=Moheibacter sediminis TaxID=1434700 RepID=A0A1W2CFZ4_9FLAO|nr:RsmD family RNA methyltransferase [Moheibacter sediminis]SMC83812.1 hypothetical protein SAMN06296427_1105 [Moheibacter sediminis]
MNQNLLQPEIQEYLRENQNQNFRKISLQKSPFSGVSSSELAHQIKGLQISKFKFPFLNEPEGIYFPPSINLEQASSWATSQYKSEIVKGKSLIDLTAGMGIDSFGFAQKINDVTALERNPELVEISKHNYKILNQNNLNYINSEFEKYFSENPKLKWDVIYLDPSRRIESQRKVILEDLEPNILDWIDEFLLRSETVLIKLSPLLDLKSTIEKIPQIQEIYIIAVKNEVKELLIICKKDLNSNPKIKAVNLESNQPDFEFNWNEESATNSTFSEPQKFIYEPSASILKSGAFKLIGEKFNLKKIHVNSHLYTSNELIKSFPGKIFEVIEELKNPKKEIEKQAFHLLVKNYPLNTEAVRKKYKIKEGIEQTLIFTQSNSGKHILLAKRVRNLMP